VDEAVARKFMLGYAPQGGSGLLQLLRQENVATEHALRLGLVGERAPRQYREKFFARLMFPIANAAGKIVAFGGRVLDNALPKYLNSSETPLFHKRSTLYGLHQAKESIRKADRVVVRDWSEETRKRDKVLYESKERADIDALGRAVSLRVPEDWTHCMCLGSVEVTLYTGENLLGSFTNQHTRNIRCSLWQSDAELADPEAFVSWFDARNMTGPRTEYDELKQQEAEFEAVQAKWLAAMPKCLIPLWTERARYGPQALDLEPFRTTLATEIADRNERVLALLEWYGWEGGSWSEYYDFEGVAKALLMDYPTAVLNAIGSSMELNYAQTKGLARLFTDETFRYQRRDELADLSHRLKRRLREHAHASEDEGEIAAVQHAFGNDW